ncbi:MAG: ABC transporter ATP-binding protein [Candidatus Dojkabacteria bacterium]|nr:ABC transporter ATP-binding protein [Candidatus Dojkabacteria bacterium]
MDKYYDLNKTEEVNTRNGLNLLVRHFKPYIGSLLVIVFSLILVNVLGTILIPSLARQAIDNNIISKDMDGLLTTLLYMLIILVFTTIGHYVRVRSTGVLSQKVLFNIRQEVFKKIQALPTQFISDNQTGDIIQRLTGNVESLNSFFSEGLVRILNTVFALISVLIAMYLLDWRIATISLGATVITLLFIIFQGKFLEKPIKESLEKDGLVSAKVQETMDGFISIQSSNQKKNWTQQFEKLTNKYYKISKKVAAISSTADTFLSFMTVLTVGGTLIYALNLTSTAGLTIGSVILFNIYSQQIFRTLDKISYIWRIIKTGLEAASRLDKILELDSNIKNPESPYSPKEIKGKVEFVDVDFGYNGEDVVLKDVNFTAYSGKTIAIVGPTGGGKTTFVNLIARLYDVRNGQIKVDDVDVKDWDLTTLRESIGYLIQDTFLFEDTILNNLKYDNPKVTEKRALDMFKFLGVESFIKSQPKGLDTKIDSDGTGISSGQRQIIALARILLRNPKILILDEATARIDTKSEKLLQTAIEKAAENKTTFVIAHRLSTIFNADHIILIKDNTILEQGNHEELIAKKGFYYEMYSKFIGDN